ncbi:hypothetical protein [Streptomyces sp. NBC_00878]|nr:hypothetical protein [Streptomyces sp. NBC_00878]MCX4906311.1 hypothetical protein [Streptomyces sp. NBC_00878]
MLEPAAEVTDAERARFGVFVRKPEAVDAPVFAAQDAGAGCSRPVL